MTSAQKTVKYLAMAFAVLLTVSIFGGIFRIAGAILGVFEEDGVNENVTAYPISEEITSLEIDVSAADLSIRVADSFSVESNLKYLTVEVQNGTLVIKDQKKNRLSFDDPVLTLYVPEDAHFAQASVTTGAGRLRIETLSAQTLRLTLGAGEVKIEKLVAEQSARIEGGTGSVTILDGSLTDLQAEMGVGTLELTAALYGNSEFELGVGETDITVLRDKACYRIGIEKGIGSVTVDRKTVDGDCELGDGEEKIGIEGGIGAIKLRFESAE